MAHLREMGGGRGGESEREREREREAGWGGVGGWVEDVLICGHY